MLWTTSGPWRMVSLFGHWVLFLCFFWVYA
jgi:hypothetical protein